MRHVKTVSKCHPITAGAILDWFQNLCLCVTCDQLPFAVQLMLPGYCRDAWGDVLDQLKKW